jgi:hypothetical protein
LLFLFIVVLYSYCVIEGVWLLSLDLNQTNNTEENIS